MTPAIPTDAVGFLAERLDRIEAMLVAYQASTMTRELYEAKHQVVERDLAELTGRVEKAEERRRTFSASLVIVGSGVALNLAVEVVKALS